VPSQAAELRALFQLGGIKKSPFVPRALCALTTYTHSRDTVRDRAVVMMLRTSGTFANLIDGQYVQRPVLVHTRLRLEMPDATALANAFQRVTMISFASDLQEMLSHDATGATADEIIGWLSEPSLSALPHAGVFVASLREFMARQSALRNTPAATQSSGEWVSACKH
jgi:hypothetical protein